MFAEVALQYNDTYNDLILSFANNIHTPDGGSHETGFRVALTRVINEYGKKFGLLKDDNKLMGEDVYFRLLCCFQIQRRPPNHNLCIQAF